MKLAAFFIIFLAYASSFAQSIEILESNYGSPYLSALIKITDENGASVAPNTSNLLIRQVNKIIVPTRVYQEGDNYRVDWVPDVQILSQSVFEADYNYLIIFSGLDKIIADDDRMRNLKLPRLYLTNVDGNNIDEIRVPNTKEPSFNIRQFYLRLNKGVWNESTGTYEDLYLDSITYDYQDVFRITSSLKWPRNIGQSSEYLFNIRFEPKEFNYYYTPVVLHFNGGYKLSFDLIGNPFNIDRNYDLELLRPRDGEIFAPCTEYEIRWTGVNKSLESIVEVTLNGGVTYNEIARTFDTSYVWTVPDTLAEFVKVRVRQRNSIDQKGFSLAGLFNPDKVALSPNGNEAVMVNRDQEFYLFDLPADNFNTIPYIPSANNLMNSDILYCEEGTVLHSFHRTRFGERIDSISIFNTASNNWINTVKSPVEIASLTDYKDHNILIVPLLSNSVYSFDYKTETFQRLVKIDKPIADISYTPQNEEIVVVDYTGLVQKYDANTLGLVSSFQIRNFPQPGLAKISPDGQYLAVSKYYVDGTVQNVFLYEMTSGERVRRVPQGWSSATKGIEFSPTSRSLLMAHSFNPQLVAYDLTNGWTESVIANGGTSEIRDFSYALEEDVFIVLQEGVLSRFAFSYPEYDENDIYAKIRNPEMVTSPVTLYPTLVADTSQYLSTAHLCNNSESPFPIKDWYLSSGEHIKLISPVDGVLEGESCTELHLEFKPTVLGDISDTLYFLSCSDTLMIPINGESLERNVSIISEPYDFGERCIGERIEISEVFFRNLDTANIKINRIEFAGNAFRASFAFDTIVQEGETWGGNVSLIPQERGKQYDTLLIYNSNLRNGPPLRFVFTYFGIGADINQSHTYLSFTPEQNIREAFIVNEEPTPIEILSLDLGSGLNHTLDVDVPLTLNTGDSLKFTVTASDSYAFDTLTVDATPCINFVPMVLGPYVANTSIIALDTVAKPTEFATLTILQKTTTENYFAGPLKLDLRIAIDADIFYPESFESDFEIVASEQSVVGDQRYMDFYMRGDFREQDTILKIIGPAALTDKTETEIKVLKDLGLISRSIPTASDNGTLTIINDSPGRQIIKGPGLQANLKIYPNPISENLTLEINGLEGDSQEQLNIRIYSQTGSLVMERNATAFKDANSLKSEISMADLPAGIYFMDVYGDDWEFSAIKISKMGN